MSRLSHAVFHLIPLVLAGMLFCLPGFSTPVYSTSGLMLSKSLPHYSEEMEFYYLKPRPEMLDDLLNFLSASGVLAHNEKQLMIAAFFAALAMENKLDLENFALQAMGLGRDASRTIAWSAHLARHKSEQSLLASLLADDNAFLARQIANSPAPLGKWDILAEPSVMHMYWGAFMATGKNAWLDRIIGASLLYGRLETQGLWRQRGYEVGRAAASALYEFAPRHPLVAKRLEYFLANSKGIDQKTLRKILRK